MIIRRVGRIIHKGNSGIGVEVGEGLVILKLGISKSATGFTNG